MKIAFPIAAGTVLALGLAAVNAPAEPSKGTADCARASTGLTPLTDFVGKRKYRGHRGGLYPNARNKPTAAYQRVGVNQARRVRQTNGQLVLLSIGMANASDEFAAFKRMADVDPAKNQRLVIVDGAQNGGEAGRIKRPTAEYWQVVDERLEAAEATADQVQVIWLKEMIAGEDRPFPRDARALQADLRSIVRIVKAKFPNLRLIYLSSRTYAGYAITGLNPEPAAYDSAFGVRWLIGERMAGKIRGPWIGWGPYLWTDGLKGRRDGLVWACEDVGQDGTHPSRSGAQKVAQQLQQFFRSDPTARLWFRGRAGPTRPPA
jgi:hypothetical protein